VSKENKDQQVQTVKMDYKVLWDLRDYRVNKESRENKVFKVHKEFKVI
jgi:hypothetical protein